MREMISVLLDY